MPLVAASLALLIALSPGAAREALDRELRPAIEDPRQAPAEWARDWHWAKWLNGPGRVGRLHDYCTGAVEPPPRLSIGDWRWETLDPQTLSADDRQKAKAWRYQQFAARWGCGTVFEIGDLGQKARQRFTDCKARPADAFTAYVARRPELRASEDELAVTVEALRDAGCR